MARKQSAKRAKVHQRVALAMHDSMNPMPRSQDFDHRFPIKLTWGQRKILADAEPGGGVIICPGVKIGSKTVIGAGSVVTRDVPAGVFAAGTPCRVVREITE